MFDDSVGFSNREELLSPVQLILQVEDVLEYVGRYVLCLQTITERRDIIKAIHLYEKILRFVERDQTYTLFFVSHAEEFRIYVRAYRTVPCIVIQEKFSPQL